MAEQLDQAEQAGGEEAHEGVANEGGYYQGCNSISKLCFFLRTKADKTDSSQNLAFFAPLPFLWLCGKQQQQKSQKSAGSALSEIVWASAVEVDREQEEGPPWKVCGFDINDDLMLDLPKAFLETTSDLGDEDGPTKVQWQQFREAEVDSAAAHTVQLCGIDLIDNCSRTHANAEAYGGPPRPTESARPRPFYYFGLIRTSLFHVVYSPGVSKNFPEFRPTTFFLASEYFACFLNTQRLHKQKKTNKKIKKIGNFPSFGMKNRLISPSSFSFPPPPREPKVGIQPFFVTPPFLGP